MSRCKQQNVASAGMSFGYHQCYNKAKKDRYCMIHHPDSVRSRQEKSDALYEEKRKKSAFYRLQRALEMIESLEKENAELKSQLEDKS